MEKDTRERKKKNGEIEIYDGLHKASRGAHFPRSEWSLHPMPPSCVPSNKPRVPFNHSKNFLRNVSHMGQIWLQRRSHLQMSDLINKSFLKTIKDKC